MEIVLLTFETVGIGTALSRGREGRRGGEGRRGREEGEGGGGKKGEEGGGEERERREKERT